MTDEELGTTVKRGETIYPEAILTRALSTAWQTIGVTTRSAKSRRSDPILQNFLAQALFARLMFGHSTGPFSRGKPR
jgi:hypothetical protein